MPSRFALSLRVLRCPGCHASLPVGGKQDVLVCEYCDAHVQVIRSKPAPAPPPPPPRQAPAPPREVHIYKAAPHYSGCAWIVFLFVLLGIGGAVVFALGLAPPELVEVLTGTPEPPPPRTVVTETTPTPPPTSVASEPEPEPKSEPDEPTPQAEEKATSPEPESVEVGRSQQARAGPDRSDPHRR